MIYSVGLGSDLMRMVVGCKELIASSRLAAGTLELEQQRY